MYGRFSRMGRVHAHGAGASRHWVFLAILMTLLILAPASSVWAQEPSTASVTLQQGADGYEGATDTYLDLGNATTVWGNADRLRTKTTENADALLRFDVTSIPAGSTVQQATLRLYAIDHTGLRPTARTNNFFRWWPSITLRSHQVLRPWAEDSATWEVAATGDAWEMPGCQGAGVDYVGEYTDEVVGFEEIRSWVEFDVTELVQQWIDNPDSNYGVVIKAYLHTVTISYSFWSSEGPLAWFRPQLVVDYQ